MSVNEMGWLKNKSVFNHPILPFLNGKFDFWVFTVVMLYDKIKQ